MKIFYHNDADGRCAGHIVAKHLGHDQSDMDKYYEITYGMEFPFDDIEKDEDIYIVDYHIEPEEMDRLLSITKNVTWVDHHKTTMEKYKDYPHDIKGYRYDGIAGCVLTWLWLNNYYIVDAAIAKVPMPVRYIGDRDVWKWEFGEKTRNYCSGAELYSMHPLSTDWEFLWKNPDQVMLQGELLEKYKAERNKSYLDEFAYEANFHENKAIVINLGQVGSEVFGDLLKEYDLGIMYVHNGDYYKVSLRSEKIDVSELALEYGGGGHAGAAGFQVDRIPWVKIHET